MNYHDYYEDLGLTEYATTEEIKAAFFALAKQHHPDKTGTNDATDFRRVRQAYNVLADPESRAEYDSTYTRNAENETGEASEQPRTRTAQCEAEEGARAGKYDHDRGPERANTYEDRPRYQRQPFHFFFQGGSPTASSFSSGSAHGMAVKMSSHPATNEHCKLSTDEWRTQTVGTEICVFCLSPVERGGSRCPGCEVMACGECLKKIIAQEHGGAFGGYGG